MPTMKFLLMLLLVMPCAGQTVADAVKKFEKSKSYTVKYDKFQMVTTVEFEKVLQGSLRIVAIANLFDDRSNDHFALYIRSVHGTLYNHATLRFLLDGELMEIPTDQIDYSIIVQISPAQMTRIVEAKSVEMQIASFEGKVDKDTLTRLRNLASLL